MENILANQTIKKRDENTISVVKSVPVQFDFTPEYLKEQIIRIQEQKDRDNSQRDLEIAECEAYLARCTELKVVEKPVEETKPVIEETPVKPLETVITK